MTTPEFIRCACGKLYKFYSMMVGDQSICPDCRDKLRREYENLQKASQK